MSDHDAKGLTSPAGELADWQKHAAFLRRVARGLLLDSGRVDDALQEAWLIARRKPRPGRAWLAGVVRRVASQTRRGEGRRQHREQVAARSEPLPSASDNLERLELTAKLIEIVRGLQEPSRSLILMRYFDDLSPAEIAERRGQPLASVRTQLRRALQRLRERMLAEKDSTPEAWLSALLPFAGPNLFPTLPVGEAGSPALGSPASASWTTAILMSSTAKFAALALMTVGGALALWKVNSTGEPFPERTGQLDVPGPNLDLPALARGSHTPATHELSAGDQPKTHREAAGGSSIPSGVADWPITGKVLRSRDLPYPGATVRLQLWDGYENEGPARVDQEMQCDGDGQFELALDSPAGTVTLRASFVGEDHYTYPDQLLIVAGDPPRALEIAAYPLDSALVGVVRSPQGDPVEGALVSGLGREVVSDPSGAYRLPLSSSHSRSFVSARSDDCASRRLIIDQLQAGEERALDIPLETCFSIRGRVTDSSGLPLSGAEIKSFYSPHPPAISDAQGEYRLTSLDANRELHSLSVKLKGYVQVSQEVADEPDGLAEQDFVLGRGTRVSGFVTDAKGHPVPGASLYIGFDPNASSRVDAVSRDDGGFVFPVVAQGSQTLVVERRGFAPHKRVFEVADLEGSRLELRVILGSAHFIAGRVVDMEGAPRRDVFVSPLFQEDYIGERAPTDEHGVFRLDDLPAAGLSIEVWGSGILREEFPIEFVDRDDLEFAVRRAGRLQGRVLDSASGEPVPSFRVRFVPPLMESGDTRLYGYSATWSREGHRFEDPGGHWDSDGSELTPGAVIGLQVQAEGFAVQQLKRVVVPEADSSAEIEVLLSRGATLLGRVLDAESGEPVAGASLRLYPQDQSLDHQLDGDPHGPSTVLTDEQGEFEVPNAAVGAVKLLVKHADHPLHVEGAIEIRERDLEVRRNILLGRGASLRGVVLSPQGVPLSAERILLYLLSSPAKLTKRWETRSDASGAFEFSQLPAGIYRVDHLSQGIAPYMALLSQGLTISEGEAAEVQLRAAGNLQLEGQLTCPTKVPGACPLRLQLVLDAEGKVPSLDETRTHGVIAQDNRFHFEGLDPGTYRLSVFYSNFTSGESWRTQEDFEVNLGDSPSAPVSLELHHWRM